jgi:hypothetical protein
MDRALRELVWRRAGNCCEYCRMPRRFDDTTFEIDHVHAAMLMQSAGRANVLRALPPGITVADLKRDAATQLGNPPIAGVL